MSGSSSRGSGAFHELPLVVFTALAIAGGGTGAAHLGGSLLSWWPWVPDRGVLAFVTGVTGMGLLASLGHLGRPGRGPLALRGLGRSPLSSEVTLVGLLLVAGLLGTILGPGQLLGRASALGAVLLSPLVLLTLGIVYRLPGQLTWGGPARAQPLMSGCAFGVLALMVLFDGGLPPGARLVAIAFLLADGLVFWGRWRRVARVASEGESSHPRVMDRRQWLSGLRVLAADLVPVAAVVAGAPRLAALALSVGLLVDRFLFYGLAVKETTEAQIARLERILWAGPESGGDRALEC